MRLAAQQATDDLAAAIAAKKQAEDTVAELTRQYNEANDESAWERPPEPAAVNMHDVCALFVKPLTEPHKCSFVDLVAEAAQAPKWFVSHAWSTPFSQTVSMLNFHVKSHKLPPTTNYWICTFANNQHDLGPRLGTRGGWVKKTSHDVSIHFPKDDNLGY